MASHHSKCGLQHGSPHLAADAIAHQSPTESRDGLGCRCCCHLYPTRGSLRLNTRQNKMLQSAKVQFLTHQQPSLTSNDALAATFSMKVADHEHCRSGKHCAG